MVEFGVPERKQREPGRERAGAGQRLALPGHLVSGRQHLGCPARRLAGWLISHHISQPERLHKSVARRDLRREHLCAAPEPAPSPRQIRPSRCVQNPQPRASGVPCARARRVDWGGGLWWVSGSTTCEAPGMFIWDVLSRTFMEAGTRRRAGLGSGDGTDAGFGPIGGKELEKA